jgi:hypothetical protein
MSGTDFVDGKELGAVYVSEEGSFATVGTERRLYPVAGSVEAVRAQTEVDVRGLRPRPWDYQAPVLGHESGTAKLTHYLQPGVTRLSDAASSADYGDALCPEFILLRCLVGAQSADIGTSVETAVVASTANSARVETGQGSRIPAGQLVQLTDPSAGLVPARILTRSTDDVTWWPNLSSAPADESAIINLVTFYPSRTNTRSLSLALCATQASSRQARLLGGTGSLQLSFEREALAQVTADLAFADHALPSALGLSTSHVADPMAAPLACRTITLYLQDQSTTTRVNYAVDKVSAKVNLGNGHIKTLTGGTNGVRGVIRSQDLNSPAIELELEGPDDSQLETWWTNRTELSAMLFVQAEHTNGRRMIVLDVPRCVIVGVPATMQGEGNLAKSKWTLKAMLDDTTSGGGVELAEAPWRLGIGG